MRGIAGRRGQRNCYAYSPVDPCAFCPACRFLLGCGEETAIIGGEAEDAAAAGVDGLIGDSSGTVDGSGADAAQGTDTGGGTDAAIGADADASVEFDSATDSDIAADSDATIETDTATGSDTAVEDDTAIQTDTAIETAPALLPIDATLAIGDPAQGQALFGQKCAECHGMPTQRSTAVHLFNQVFLALASDGFLRHAIVYGRPGTDRDPWAKELKPKQIDDLIAYLRSLAVADAAVPPPPPAGPPAEPWIASPVLNPAGQHAEFQLKDDRLVTPEAVNQALTQKRRIVIADARAPSDWARLRIPGAVSLPYYDLRNIDKIPNDGTWVIAYCACPHHASGVVVDELRRRGYKHTAVMDEGIFAFQHKGFEVVASDGGVPTPAPPAYDQPHLHPGLHAVPPVMPAPGK